MVKLNCGLLGRIFAAGEYSDNTCVPRWQSSGAKVTFELLLEVIAIDVEQPASYWELPGGGGAMELHAMALPPRSESAAGRCVQSVVPCSTLHWVLTAGPL